VNKYSTIIIIKSRKQQAKKLIISTQAQRQQIKIEKYLYLNFKENICHKKKKKKKT